MRPLVILLLLTTSAVAGPKMGWWPESPPAEFIKPYTGALTVIRLPLRQIPEHCWSNPRAYACAYNYSKTGACVVYLPNNVPEKLEVALREHEMGHCNGWKHPQDMKYLMDAAQRRAKTSALCQDKPKPEGCP